jgi:hypothetical protein
MRRTDRCEESPVLELRGLATFGVSASDKVGVTLSHWSLRFLVGSLCQVLLTPISIVLSGPESGLWLRSTVFLGLDDVHHLYPKREDRPGCFTKSWKTSASRVFILCVSVERP